MNLWIALLGTLVAELYVLRRLRFDGFIVGLVLASTIVYLNYLSYTSVSERNYDGSVQLVYIEAIAQHFRLPDVNACGPCGHPPLYYALAALWSKTVLVGGWLPFELGLQWLSVLLFFGFVVISLQIFRSFGAEPSTLRLAAALVLFWPSSIINSVRVHNDALASVLMLAAMHFTSLWDRQQRSLHFYAALAASALALLTKASGYTVAATLVFFAVLRLRTPDLRREKLRQCATAVLVLTAAAILAVGLRQSAEPRSVCQQILGHACDGRYVPVVVDKPSRYVSFDAVDLVRRIDSLPIDPAHDYFLNRMAKSSLFGVMPLGDEFGTKRHEALAMLISLLLLVMVAVCALAVPFLRGVQLRKYRAYFVSTALMFLFLVAFRIRAPNEFHEDFRHIFPALVPFSLGYATIVERVARSSKVLRLAGVGVGLMMVLSSVAFFARLP